MGYAPPINAAYEPSSVKLQASTDGVISVASPERCEVWSRQSAVVPLRSLGFARIVWLHQAFQHEEIAGEQDSTDQA